MRRMGFSICGATVGASRSIASFGLFALALAHSDSYRRASLCWTGKVFILIQSNNWMVLITLLLLTMHVSLATTSLVT